jgi:hypothetical protein
MDGTSCKANTVNPSATRDPTPWIYDDGGRAAAGYKGEAGDCVVRAIAIASQLPYQKVYDDLFRAAKEQRLIRRRKRSPRDGVYKQVFRRYLEELGWKFIPTMSIGSGCKVHLRADELPQGRVVVSVSKHLVAVVDGVVHDIYDPRRGGMRCVYGYFVPLHAAPRSVIPVVGAGSTRDGGEAPPSQEPARRMEKTLS